MREDKPGDNRDEEPCAILFIDRTPSGELTRRIRMKECQMMDTIGNKVKIIERAGNSLKHQLWNADPWGGAGCVDEKCPVCTDDQDKQICNVRNIIYSNSCLTCRKYGKTAVYIGKTSRTLKERALEHVEDGVQQREFSHLHTHKKEMHREEDMKMKFELVRRCKMSFERQIGETIRIQLL